MAFGVRVGALAFIPSWYSCYDKQRERVYKACLKIYRDRMALDAVERVAHYSKWAVYRG